MVVVGLGPAGADLVTPRARRVLDDAAKCLVRTERHPAVDELRDEGLELISLDRHYEEAPDLDTAYAAIVDEVARAAAEHGTVVYAVPGNPGVAERTVTLLRDRDVEVEIVPGLSFAELAWARVGVDPMTDGARLVDGRDLGREEMLAGGPLLLAQCDTAGVLNEVKLTLLDELVPGAEVTVLQRLGLPDESVRSVALADLDRDVDADHLTSVFVDLGVGAAQEFARFVALIETLRGPGGCPWDAEQTHHSLVRHLVEETYEVVDVLERLPADAPGGDEPVPVEDYALVEEELGDLTAQVVFHATLAREEGAFTMREVLRGIREKLVYRHPHVFADTEADTADDVMRNWEQLKRAEKQSDSLVDEVPMSLPGLLLAHKLYRKADAAGLPLLTASEAAAVVEDTARRLADLPEDAVEGDVERLLGDLVATVALLARQRGIDAERAIRGWSHRFRGRFRAAEGLARERGASLHEFDGDAVAALWLEAAGRDADSSA